MADEIGLTLFENIDLRKTVQFSPDEKYFAVDTERGRLDVNQVEGSLRFYRSQDVEDFLKDSDQSEPPSPVWFVHRYGKQSGVISDWRWLADSSGVGFLERTATGSRRLVLANLRKRTVEPLTAATETIEGFDIRDRNHYVYTTGASGLEQVQAKRRAPVIVGTGRSLYELSFPDDPIVVHEILPLQRHLWAVIGGKRFEVRHEGMPIAPDEYDNLMALSPDGQSLVTKLPVPDVPLSWESLYPPASASDYHRIHAGRHDSAHWPDSVHQYALIHLQTGSVRTLTDAPIGWDGGSNWAVAHGGASWSNDGQEILLPGTFLKSKENVPSRPCVAVVDLPSNMCTCVEILKGQTETGLEEGFHEVEEARFQGGDKKRIMVTFSNPLHGDVGTTEYERMADGTWRVAGEIKGVPKIEHRDLEIDVKQGLNEPPRLVAMHKRTSRVIWDPNPQLKAIELGEASVYAWKDKEGRDWKGGLYKPSDYKPGQRYPLVIQPYAFFESQFSPSGMVPTAFAARALAAAGIVVLQVGQHCTVITSGEAACVVSGYEAAANQLISDGLVDPGRIGLIGFSRSCFWVMEGLTTSSLHFKAASITDGFMADYFQYLLLANAFGESLPKQMNLVIGAAPFGEGLQQWLKRSPGFHLDRVTAPLLVNAGGTIQVLFMWGPYAGLHYLHKPVDFMILNNSPYEHVLSNPAARMASQGGSVDWFRFWLQDYEDPDPSRTEQYKRWRELRKLQEHNLAPQQ